VGIGSGSVLRLVIARKTHPITVESQLNHREINSEITVES